MTKPALYRRAPGRFEHFGLLRHVQGPQRISRSGGRQHQWAPGFDPGFADAIEQHLGEHRVGSERRGRALGQVAGEVGPAREQQRDDDRQSAARPPARAGRSRRSAAGCRVRSRPARPCSGASRSATASRSARSTSPASGSRLPWPTSTTSGRPVRLPALRGAARTPPCSCRPSARRGRCPGRVHGAQPTLP